MTNHQRRQINICQCYLLLREKFGIDSIKAKAALERDFFVSQSYLTGNIIPEREAYRNIKLDFHHKSSFLVKLQRLKPTSNPLFS